MTSIRGTPGAGPYASVTGESTSQAKLEEVMSTSSTTMQTDTAELAAALKNKAKTTKGLTPQQKTAYDRRMLAAVQDTKSKRLTDASKMTVAAVVPGALGALQPSGADLARAIPTESQMASMDLQNALQKQQRANQMLSNILKAQHDTASSIIRNLR